MKLYTQEVRDREILDMVRRMANVAEYREPGMLHHRERVRAYSLLIARHLDLSEPDAEIIANATILHDIGKIGLPDEIISKTGDLTAYEWEVTKRHTTIGATILKGSNSPILQAGEIIALTHHERWDGSGYPNQLVGEAIPLSGRICALADVYDALTTRRTYKPGIPVDKALRLVYEASGTLFDPLLVDIFLKNKSEVLRIYNASANQPA